MIHESREVSLRGKRQAIVLKLPFTHLLTVSNLAEKYTNCSHYKGKEARDSMSAKWMLRLFASKDYRLKDVIGVLKASAAMGKKHMKMWDSLLDVDIRQMTEELTMPVLFFRRRMSFISCRRKWSRLLRDMTICAM